MLSDMKHLVSYILMICLFSLLTASLTQTFLLPEVLSISSAERNKNPPVFSALRPVVVETQGKRLGEALPGPEQC